MLRYFKIKLNMGLKKNLHNFISFGFRLIVLAGVMAPDNHSLLDITGS
jgi:hypothetical protein